MAEHVPAGVYDWCMDLGIPVVHRGFETTLTRKMEGEVRVTEDGAVTVDQLREYLVNEVAAEHRGKTVEVRMFEVTGPRVAT
jgi:hypothetical protein